MLRSILSCCAAIFMFAGAAVACPNISVPAGASYEVSGKYLYEPRGYSVVAGGENLIWNCPSIRPGTDQGAGYFPTAPDFSFFLSNMGPYKLDVRVVSECDAALLINTASGSWFYDDDDNGNLDPRIVLTRPANGRIDIWIGTFDGDFCNAQLQLETFDK